MKAPLTILISYVSENAQKHATRLFSSFGLRNQDKLFQ